jgi:hypothetical protein
VKAESSRREANDNIASEPSIACYAQIFLSMFGGRSSGRPFSSPPGTRLDTTVDSLADGVASHHSDVSVLAGGAEALAFLEPGSKDRSINLSISRSISPLRLQ